MTRIFVLSDTHMPRTATELPQCMYDEIKNCDFIIHAGDFVEIEFLKKLAYLKPIRAVCGNMDSQAIRQELKQKEMIEVGNFKIGLTHGYGAPGAIIETVRSEFDRIDAIVFGHSHSALNMTKDGVLFFNPGSPTDTVFAKFRSYGILEITEKAIEGKIIKL